MASFIGIDIGARWTKVVELDCPPNIGLLNHFLFDTPYLPQGLPPQIDARRFWEEVAKDIPLERVKVSRLGINLPSGSIIALTMLIPQVAKSEIAIVAQTEAKRKMIPASEPSHVFETSIVGARITAKIPRLEVLVARSDRLYVQQILELFKQINTAPLLITFPSSSLFCFLPDEALSKKEVDAAFVDIGFSSITTSILREGRLTFFRNTAFGLRDIFQDIAKNLSRPEEAIERVIQESGVPEVSFDLKDRVAMAEEIMRQKYEASLKAAEPPQKEEINLLELRLLWQTHIERILHELRRSLSYYKEQSDGRRVEYLYFLGGGCQIKNLVDILVKQIGGQWQIVLPFKAMQTGTFKEKQSAEDQSSTPIFSNAAGIALSMALKSKGIEAVNFLPLELKRKKLLAVRRLILQTALAASLFIFTLASLGLSINNRLLKASIKKIDTDLEKIKNAADSLKDLNQRQNKINQAALQIQEIIKKKPDFAAPLRDLAHLLPKEILLTEIDIHKKEVKEEGVQTQPVFGQEEPQMPTQNTSPPALGVTPPQMGTVPPQIGVTQTVSMGAQTQQYQIEIKAQVLADYETALELIEDVRQALEKTGRFNNVNTAPLKLEKISPQTASDTSRAISLTRPMVRTFSLTADIVFEPKNENCISVIGVRHFN